MSNHNSPDRMEDNRSWQSVGGNNFNSNQHQDIEEVCKRVYNLAVVDVNVFIVCFFFFIFFRLVK